MHATHSKFTRPTAPRSIGELWYWFIFEPHLLQKFSDGLTVKQRRPWLLKGLAGLLPLLGIVLIVRLLLVLWIVEADLPTHYPENFHPTVIAFWQSTVHIDVNDKIWFLFFPVLRDWQTAAQDRQ